MFTIILYYFIIVTFIVGAFINFIFWMEELFASYKYSANQRKIINELLKGHKNM